MSDATDTIEGYDFKLEDAGPARKRLSITISADVIDEKLSESMSTLQGQSALPGFRKGKAPSQLLERRFGSAVREDARNELMQGACQKAFEHFKVRPLAEMEPADPDAEYVIEKGTPLSFVVEFEVIPEFDMPDVSAIEIAKPQLEVTDEHIDEELERQCMRMGTAEERQGDFAPADRLLGRCDLFVEGEDEPIFSHEQVLAVIPEKGESGQMLGLKIEDLGAAFAKASVGDELDIETIGPDAHEREDIRGKKLRLHYTIHLAERITPAAVNDLIERFSLASEDVLREQVRLALEQQRDEEQASVMREQMVKALRDQVKMELPERASGRQIQADLERIRMELMQRGVEQDEVENKLAEVRERSESQTRDHMRSWFVLERVANDEDIVVSEQEINGRIATMAMQQGARPDALRAELVKHDRIMPLARSIRERKATDLLVSRAKITDITMDEWTARRDAAEKAASG